MANPREPVQRCQAHEQECEFNPPNPHEAAAESDPESAAGDTTDMDAVKRGSGEHRRIGQGLKGVQMIFDMQRRIDALEASGPTSDARAKSASALKHATKFAELMLSLQAGRGSQKSVALTSASNPPFLTCPPSVPGTPSTALMQFRVCTIRRMRSGSASSTP